MADEQATVNPDKQRRYQTILVVLAIVVTCASFWLIRQANWIRERHTALEWAIAHNVPVGVLTGAKSGVYAPWSIRVLGETALEPEVIGVAVLTPEDREMASELKRLFPEIRIRVSDKGKPPEPEVLDVEIEEAEPKSAKSTGEIPQAAVAKPADD